MTSPGAYHEIRSTLSASGLKTNTLLLSRTSFQLRSPDSLPTISAKRHVFVQLDSVSDQKIEKLDSGILHSTR